MSIIFFLIALGLLIFVHELGHFLVAKRVGVCVEEFSMGFGPRLIGVKRGETDYRISVLPLGGYVKILGQDDGEDEINDPRSFAKKTIWQRVAIVAFGPVMNILFAAIVMPLVFFIGRSEPVFLHQPPIVMDAKVDSPAARAGFLKGDLITAIDGKKVSEWEDVLNTVILSEGRRLTFSLKRDRNALEKDVDVVSIPEFKGGFVGVEPMLFLGNDAVIDNVAAGGAAAKAGIKPKDRVVSFNGEPVSDWMDLSSKVNEFAGTESKIEVMRGEEKVKLSITPEFNKEANRWLIGIMKDRQSGLQMAVVKYGLVDSLIRGTKENIKLVALTFEVLKRLFTLELSYKVLGGPVVIAKASAAAAASGISHFLYFLAFLSLQLAIINLLPIPVLDGGHLAFMGIEAIKRKPVSIKIRRVLTQVGFCVLIAFMLIVTWNDVNSLFNVKAWIEKLF